TQNGEKVGELNVVRFENMNRLRPGPHGLLYTDPDNRAISAKGLAGVKQGHREASNSNPVDEMVKMVSNYRAYEASQKIIRQISQSIQRLNAVGSPT
ncbi:MAG: flagellar basal-body rod protein FlgF, partial [Planctomycetes bacterium]|nr:flagellar basal-body rod protein FlgF [Planctomycetota bacterium]